MFRIGLLLVSLASLVAPSLAAAQHSHTDLNARGQAVMGFDQERTTHHFRLFTDGGSIEVDVQRAEDLANLTAIQQHLPHIAQMFAAGRFDAPMLVHDRADVPGTAAMTAHSASIRYLYVPTPSGGRVEIRTDNPDALAGVHAFLKYQIADHATGDSDTIIKR